MKNTKVIDSSFMTLNVLVLVNTRITLQNIFAQPEKQQLQHARIFSKLKTLLIIYNKQALASPAIARVPNCGLDGRAATEEA